MRVSQEKKYKQHLRMAQKRFQDSMEKLAEQIHKEVIFPLCKEYGLEFVSGNGDFFFILWVGKLAHRYGDPSDFGTDPDPEMRKMQKALELLCTEVYHNYPLGYYVRDVSKRDYQ